MPLLTSYFEWCETRDAEIVWWNDLIKYKLTNELAYVNGELGFTMINPDSKLAWFKMVNPTYDMRRNLIEQVFYCNEYDTYAVVLYDIPDTLSDFG